MHVVPDRESSLTFTLRELRQLEDERVASEKEAADQRRRDAEAAVARLQAEAAEAVRITALAAAEHQAREVAEQRARELTERIARIQADLEVERERHATERARLEADLAKARSVSPRRWPIWVAIAASLACTVGAALWLDGRLAEQRRHGDQAASAMAADLGARIDDAGRRAADAQHSADTAGKLAADAARRPAGTSAPSTPTPTASDDRDRGRPKPPRPTPPKAPPSKPPPIAKPCTAGPLCGLDGN